VAVEPSGFAHARRAQRIIKRLEKSGRIPRGESIEAVAYAQRWLPFLQFALFLGAIGDVLFLVVARPYYLVATSSEVLLFRVGRFIPSVGTREFAAPLAEVRLERLRGGPLRRVVRLRALTGDEHRLAVHRLYWKELDRLDSLAGT
jgi:hypothetical protein